MTDAPVTLRPLPEEALCSTVRRLAVILGHRDTHRFGTPRTGNLYSDQSQLMQYEAILGISSQQLMASTLSPNLRRGVWNLPEYIYGPGQIECACGMTSYWSQLLLVTICPFCEQPFAGASAQDDTGARELQSVLLEHLKTKSAVPVRLQRLTPLIELLVPSRGHKPYMRRELWTGARSPGAMLRFANWAWPATETESALTAAQSEAMRRVLGLVPQARPASAELASRNLDSVLAQARLRSHQLPEWLPATGADELGAVGPLQATIRRSAAAAITSRLVANHPLGDLAPFIDPQHGRPDSPPWAAWFIGPDGLTALAELVADLVREPLTDFHYTRCVMGTMNRIPPSVANQLSISVDSRERELAAAWVWLDATRGSLKGSPCGLSNTLRVVEFSTRLTPEDRLLLRDFGCEYLQRNAATAAATSTPEDRNPHRHLGDGSRAAATVAS